MPNSLIINHFYDSVDPDSFSIRSSDDLSLFQDYANPYVTKSAEPIIRDDTGFYFVYNGIGRGSDIVYKYDSNLNATPLWTLALGSEFSLGTRVFSGRACISGNHLYVYIMWVNGIVVQGYRIYMIDKTTGALITSRATRTSSSTTELWIQNGVLYNSTNTGVCRIYGYSLTDLTDVGAVITPPSISDARYFAVVSATEVWAAPDWVSGPLYTCPIWKCDANFTLQTTYNTLSDINPNDPDYDYIASIRYIDNYIFVLGWKSLSNQGKVYKVDPANGSVLASSLVGYSFDFEVFSPTEPAAIVTNSIGQVIW